MPSRCSAISEYTQGGWMPPQLPSASCRSTIQSTSRRRARARPGWRGRRSYSFWITSSHQNRPDPGTRVSSRSVPGATSSGTSTPSGRTGRREITISRGAIVPRAQHAKSYRLNGAQSGKWTSSGGMLGTPAHG